MPTITSSSFRRHLFGSTVVQSLQRCTCDGVSKEMRVYPKLVCNFAQSPISGPDQNRVIEDGTAYELKIGDADSSSVQLLRSIKPNSSSAATTGAWGKRARSASTFSRLAILPRANSRRMYGCDMIWSFCNSDCSFSVSTSQMVYPDRSIDQDQSFVLRRGAASAAGSLPPRDASRRAASLRTRRVSASLTRAAFSVIPV